MSQEIKIGVKGDVSGGKAVLDQIDKAAAGVADSVAAVGQEARSATKDVNALEQAARRLAQTQKLLQKEYGRRVSPQDAEAFQNNFTRMRAGNGMGSRRLRSFEGFDDWLGGHEAGFSRPGDAARHRQFIMSASARGTGLGAPPAGGGGGPADGGGGGNNGGAGGGNGGSGGGNARSQGVARSQSIAMGFVKGSLAMAGINSVTGMIASGVDQATESAIGTDTLKRQMGDLGVDFDTLRTQARNAAAGLGITTVESVRMAQQYARVAGNLTADDQTKIGGQLRTAYSFSRAFGVDPTEGTQFFANMRRVGVVGGKDDQDGRKTAGFIADAIERGGYAGRADEVLAAISNFSDTFARNSLARPDSVAYAGMLSGLTSTGLPGLDPTSAATLLSTADASIRKGGGMGEASQNFNYMALMRASPGMDPVSAKALMQGGLLGTTSSIFGKGAALAGMYGGPLDDVTNLEKIRNQTKQMYGSGKYGVEAFSRDTNLTIAQAKELFDASPLKLAQSKDLDQKGKEQDIGTITRQAAVDLKNELEGQGTKLLDPLNKIKEAVVALAEHFSPTGFTGADASFSTSNAVSANPSAAAYAKANPKKLTALGKQLRTDAQSQARWAMLGFPAWLDGDNAPLPPQFGKDSPKDQAAIIQARKSQHAEIQHVISMMADSDKILGLRGGSTLKQIWKESKFVDQDSPAGAQGIAQFMPGTVDMLRARFKKQYGRAPNASNWEDAVLLNRMYMGDNLKREHGDYAKALSLYNSGRKTPNNAETRDYVATLTGHPLPAGPVPSTSASPNAVKVHITADPVMLTDPTAAPRGLATLKPSVQPQPAGA